MALGICCHWLDEKTLPKCGRVERYNAMDERTLQLGRYRSGKYTSEQISGTYEHNVESLIKMLPKISASGVKLFRISSAMFPLADQVDPALWRGNEKLASLLDRAGRLIKEFGMRVTTHPGQFCVLSSDSESVVDKAVMELNIHGWMFDAMGLDRSPRYAINIHGGKSDRSEQLIRAIDRLGDDTRNRLTLENDETAYSVIQLLDVYRQTNVPIVFDTHHHVFNEDSLTMEEAMEATRETWPNGIRPLQHISNTEPGMENGSFPNRRKHSEMIHYVPESQLKLLRERKVDVEVEAKQKNFAVFDMSKKFDIPLN
jgi:UV DNA damage endonuclease